jgi:membrane-associated phospholipid phosphatase
MHWQFIVAAGFIVAVALFLTVLFLYSNLRGSHNTGQKVLRLRTDRALSRSTTKTDCRG